LIPGDPGRIQLGMSATQEAVDTLNKQWGLDQPFFIRFFNFMAGIVTRFDFGKSYRTNEPVVNEIIRRLPVTAGIAFYGVLTVLVLGVPLGILSAVRRATWVDTSVTVYAMFLSAIPSFWFALLLLYVFSLILGMLPTHGVESWRGYILPIAAMSVPASSGFIRLTRVTMLDVVYQEYIKTARAKGARESIVIWKHAFKNAMLPSNNGAGLMFTILLGGTVMIVTIFTIPGVGRLLVIAIQQRDIPIVMGCTIFLATIFMVIVLLIDIVYAMLDPRVRARFAS
jgi:peptide/nickel transport system permease protein